MASPRGKKEAGRALALGALVRKLRRDQGLTLAQLAKRIPMSASNLSRVELGSQGPPADEVIERIAVGLEADPDDLLWAAGRASGGGQSFEEQILGKLDVIGRDVRAVKQAISRKQQ
jgi:transcriptional regulator with XRE-family HTH domain